MSASKTNPDYQIEYRRVDELKPARDNPRIHSRDQLKQLVASIRRYGFTNPILIGSDCEVIAGHGRLAAAKEAGLERLPVIVLEGMTEAAKRQLRIADNKIALNSEWDPDLLRLNLQEIIKIDSTVEIEAMGFSVGEVDVLLAAPKARPDPEVPALQKRAVNRIGDIWTAGPHRIACGDCRDRELMTRLFDGEAADVAFLDPPYNVRIQGHANTKSTHREFAVASGEMSQPEFQAFLVETLGACVAVSRAGAVHFVCIDHHHIDEAITATSGIYSERLNICFWNKSNAGMGSLYRSQHEIVLVLRVDGGPHFNAVQLGKNGRNRTNVWSYPSVNTLRGPRRHDLALHPTVKPIQLVTDAIQDVSRRGDLVLDGFLGSGTTWLAAERCGRRFAGTELDPLYADLCIRRWMELTNEPVIHVATGQPFLEAARSRLHEASGK